jgi:hypothetical protein
VLIVNRAEESNGDDLQAVGEPNRLGPYEWPADVELDLRVSKERDVSRVPLIGAAVDEGHDRPVHAGDLARRQRLPPNIEEIAEGVYPLRRRFDMHDSIRRVRMKPAEAGSVAGNGPLRRSQHVHRGSDADAVWDLSRLSADEDRQVDMNVIDELLGRLALDAVDRLARA